MRLTFEIQNCFQFHCEMDLLVCSAKNIDVDVNMENTLHAFELV